ncbi:MAG: glutathione S-transferase family protein [Alphaproteobacteria bacterium]|nr:glutathione S-transferase family protein [Alphaproteobacteria bacterium]MBV9694938.1 glutathione S-transferase family protein [Alphaproteobacteria bacterium]
MLTLHQMHMSGNCYKVRLLSRQLAIPIALKEYGLFDGATRRPDFLAKNPNGRVPLLELDDGRCLAESGAILWYLAEGTALVPQDPFARAQALQWMFFEQYSHEPYVAVARFWLAYAPKAELDKKRHLVGEWHEKGNAALGVMQTHLAARDWFAGDDYSIADIALYGYTHCAEEGGFDLAHFPAVRRWLARVAGTDGFVPLSERL